VQNENYARKTAELLKQIEHANSALVDVRAQLVQRDQNLRNTISVCENLSLLLSETRSTLAETSGRNAQYHRMSKDFFISTYRKIRRTLGMWNYS
jgi:hypothetical protein